MCEWIDSLILQSRSNALNRLCKQLGVPDLKSDPLLSNMHDTLFSLADRKREELHAQYDGAKSSLTQYQVLDEAHNLAQSDYFYRIIQVHYGLDSLHLGYDDDAHDDVDYDADSEDEFDEYFSSCASEPSYETDESMDDSIDSQYETIPILLPVHLDKSAPEVSIASC
uniref:ARAD1B09988p n=1 Tax=Blastobotrys adeninivorans TaxID=409370 RepID=A0A060T696_BLAAD